MSNEIDLSDVSDDDLMKELSKRYLGLVIGHVTNRKQDEELIEVFGLAYSGGQCQALGIVTKLKDRIMWESTREGE